MFTLAMMAGVIVFGYWSTTDGLDIAQRLVCLLMTFASLLGLVCLVLLDYNTTTKP